jgi:large subunit ribosomal protein L10
MNRDQKTAVVEEVASEIQEAEAVFAVDYRGISVPQAAVLRERLTEAGARFRIVKNTLTLLAADKAGAEPLKGVLEGPTAFTFVTAEGGDVALAARALAQFNREHGVLVFKGGLMNGEPLSAEQITELSRLPARDVLHGQLVGVVASPITGLVRTLNALIAGLAIQLKQIVDEGKVPVGGAEAAPGEAAGSVEAAAEEGGPEPAAEEAAAPEESDPAEVEQAAQAEQAEEEAAQSAEDQETESSSEESAPASEEAAGEGTGAAGEATEESETPSEGDEKE